MASKGKTTTVSEKPANRNQKTKAQQAVGKTDDEIRTETRNLLVGRLAAGILLLFLALFLFLSMVGVHAALLDAIRSLAKGLFGYGYWMIPPVSLFIAWFLVFRNDEPARLRIVSFVLLVVSLSALLHGIFCRTEFSGGLKLFSGLWRTGIDNASGGVIPGLIAQGLIFLISRGGAIPVLLVLTVVLVFLSFKISAGLLLHKHAQRRRELLEELPEPEPIPEYNIMEDLRVVATRPILPRREPRRSTDFDIDLESEDSQPETRRLRPFKPEEQADNLDDDLVFFRDNAKPRKVKKLPKENGFDIPLGDDKELLDEQEEYTESYDIEIRDDQELPLNDIPIASELAKNKAPEMLDESQLTEAAMEAMKGSKVSKTEAAAAAAQVAMEIEAATDAEAQAPPVYQFPPMTMLTEALGNKEDNTEEMRTNVLRLEETLKSFGVDISVENVVRGPTVTRYEMQLRPGIKMSKITSLHADIALSLGVTNVRVSAVPGKSSVIGIEVPNRITTSVPIREVLSSREFSSHKSNLAFAAGKDIGGNYIVGDIAKMPHLLIAGTTGSGKSVCMNSIIVSLLYRASPEKVRLIMIDPKVVELSIYNGIPHLLIPVVTDAKKAAGALQWAVTEMERRYRLLADYKVRDLAGYNKLAANNPDMTEMPQVVVIIDELADLMLVAAKEVENSIVRIAQKARAAGMHLVIATQRPSADVITGVMKANIPSRIAFAVSSALESRIILDDSGAEKLVGKGDMLFAPLGSGKPKRVQGCFITDEEVEEVVEFVKNSSEADYSEEILKEIEQNASGSEENTGAGEQTAIPMDGDELLPDAVEVILDTKQASVSMLQRRLKLGYAHAARIVDEMEEKGIVGPFEGSKPRQLLITREQWNTMVGINPRAVAPSSQPQEVPEEEPPFEPDEEL